MQDLPPDIESAAVALGNRVRLAIIRSLALDGAATAMQLQRRLELLPRAAHRNLALLEQHGLIHAHPSRQDEPGPVTRHYTLDRARYHALSEALVTWVP